MSRKYSKKDFPRAENAPAIASGEAAARAVYAAENLSFSEDTSNPSSLKSEIVLRALTKVPVSPDAFVRTSFPSSSIRADAAPFFAAMSWSSSLLPVIGNVN